ncbi:MAG: hypothetical protein KAS12_04665 [Candidatus Aenigmarchaeota archaeon]|nr:hypothetical protein [Candidatus Aenigmarchaeota archaeon]
MFVAKKLEKNSKYFPKRPIMANGEITDLEMLVDKFPNESWQFDDLTFLTRLSKKFIKEHPDFQYDPMIMKSRMSYDDIQPNHHICSSLWDDIECYKDEKLNWRKLSSDPALRWDFVKANLGKKWDWRKISKNPAISWETILNEKNFENGLRAFGAMTSKIPWDIRSACVNPNVTIDIIKKYPEIFNDAPHLSRNPNMTWDFVESHKDFNWNWKKLGKNPGIKIEDILGYLYNDWTIMEWDWFYVSMRPDVTIEIIKRTPYLNWDVNGFSYNPSLTYHDVMEHSDWPWNWRAIAVNRFDTISL